MFLKYDVKVLVALCEAFDGNKELFQFLGRYYPELAAFSKLLKNDFTAQKWLMENKFMWLSAINDAIDGNLQAIQYLQKGGYQLEIYFVKAVNKDPKAILLLNEQAKVLKVLAERVTKYLKEKEKKDDKWGEIFRKIVNPMRN